MLFLLVRQHGEVEVQATVFVNATLPMGLVVLCAVAIGACGDDDPVGEATDGSATDGSATADGGSGDTGAGAAGADTSGVGTPGAGVGTGTGTGRSPTPPRR